MCFYAIILLLFVVVVVVVVVVVTDDDNFFFFGLAVTVYSRFPSHPQPPTPIRILLLVRLNDLECLYSTIEI